MRGWGEQKRNQKQRMRPAQPSAFCGVLIKPIVPFRVEHMFRAWLRFGTEISMVLGPMACRGGEPAGGELRGTIPKPYKNRQCLPGSPSTISRTGNKTTRKGSRALTPVWGNAHGVGQSYSTRAGCDPLWDSVSQSVPFR